MSTQDNIVRNRPDENPVKNQAIAGSNTGKNYNRANIPKLGGPTNVDASHLWRKLACIESTQIPPDNSRGNVFQVRGLLDVEIPGSQVHTPDNVVFQVTVTNTAQAEAAVDEQRNYRQIHLNTPHTWIEYMEELPNGGSPENTWYALDFKEWMMDCNDEEVRRNASLCHFYANSDPQQVLAGSITYPAANIFQKVCNGRFGDPTDALTIWPANIRDGGFDPPADRTTPNSATVFIPIKVPWFSGHTYWPALSVRPRLRFYFNTTNAILDIDSSRNVNPFLQTGTSNLIRGWNQSGWTSYDQARNSINVSNYQLIMSGLVYGGSAKDQMAQIYAPGYAWPCLTPQRMIINFDGTGTLEAPDDSAYQTLTSIQGMFAWLRYYVREQGAEINAGTFDDFFEIVRTTLRDSGGKTIGFEKIPGEILAFDQEKRGRSNYATNVSEKLNYHSNDHTVDVIANGAGLFNPNVVQDPVTPINNIPNGYANSANAPRVLTDVYCDDMELAKEGAQDGAENFDGNYTLQLAIGRSVTNPAQNPSEYKFTLHIHGKRYSTYSQDQNGKFIVIKH